MASVQADFQHHTVSFPEIVAGALDAGALVAGGLFAGSLVGGLFTGALVAGAVVAGEPHAVRRIALSKTSETICVISFRDIFLPPYILMDNG
jgi:hypothetical protein